MRSLSIIFSLFLLAACTTQLPETGNPFLDDPLHCNVDADCTCGGMFDGECFVGNVLFANTYADMSKNCFDFCSGVAGNLITKCVDNQCQLVETVACTEEAKICPDGSAVGRVGPDCEFAPCPGVQKTILVREVTWGSLPPAGEEPIMEETTELVDAVPGVSFGANPPVPGDAFRVIDVTEQGVRISVDSENYVACGEPVSSSRTKEEWLLSEGELCFRTRSLDSGYDYHISLAECFSDSDCVPASCCHAAACVPKSEAPSCDGVMCTMECQPGTLDCGGSCACVDGECRALFAQ